MKSITKVKTTPEFMQRYNEFRREVLTKIQEVQKDILKENNVNILSIVDSSGKCTGTITEREVLLKLASTEKHRTVHGFLPSWHPRSFLQGHGML